jgi:hypothetical protein
MGKKKRTRKVKKDKPSRIEHAPTSRRIRQRPARDHQKDTQAAAQLGRLSWRIFRSHLTIRYFLAAGLRCCGEGVAVV